MPGGFKYVGTDQQGTELKLRTYDVTSSHASIISVGDVVRITGTATTSSINNTVDVATATQSVTGVVAGIVPQYATESFTDTGLAASTAGQVVVNTDPFAYYEVDVSNGPLAAADVGLNVDLVATAATKSGGLTISNMSVNATGKATTNTLPFRVEALLQDSAGVWGNRARIRINNSTYNSGTTGV